MKLKKIAILLLALLMALSSSALAKVTIETSLDKLAEANGSSAVEGQNGAVDGIIHFDYNGKDYTYYHINDGANGYFLPVEYMKEALDAAYDLSTPSEEVTGYWAALEEAMNAFLNRNSDGNDDSVETDTSGVFDNAGGDAAPADTSDNADDNDTYSPYDDEAERASQVDDDVDYTPSGSGSASSSGSSSGGSSSGSGSSGSSGSGSRTSTPELGDESLPLPSLVAFAALAFAGVLYARRKSHQN